MPAHVFVMGTYTSVPKSGSVSVGSVFFGFEAEPPKRFLRDSSMGLWKWCGGAARSDG